ncbi:hypothetical protein HYDPIDRAFT_135397, partial [Hydnomerulius pinastri MD-312]
MPSFQVPLVDDENPLYCPNLSASAYLATLRQILQSNALNLQDFDLSLHSFFRKLGTTIFKEELPKSRVPVGHVFAFDVSEISSPEMDPTVIYG